MVVGGKGVCAGAWGGIMEAFMEFGHRDGRESDGGSP
jgi:hypothetical protein